MKSKTILIVFLVFCFVPQISYGEVVDRIIAIVNNDVITSIELNKVIVPYIKKINSLGYSGEKKEQALLKIKKDMLNRLIDRKLTDQEIARLSLKISDEELNNAIERLKKSKFMSQEDIEKILKKEGISFKDYRERIRKNLLRPKLVNFSVKSRVVITDKDIEKYYNNHKEEFAGINEYHVFNIFFAVPPYASDALKAEKLNKINQIIKMLENGEDFKILAQNFSESKNAFEGGNLGILRLETLDINVRKAISQLNKGEYTGAIMTDQGYQIFYLENIHKIKGKSLEQVSEEISKKLYNEILEEKFDSWLDLLRKKSYIKIML
ncbi:MAG: hypothetical protein B6I26_06400 [Desulfobacteraceae bacterium 4572_130]|nr:MAG: hypothetical protein B6I26_06400 [Desulfobacteraceae bacterium 4572_130]